MTGRVRVLPPDTPGLPPSVPFDPLYDDSATCMSTVWAVDAPEIMDVLDDPRHGVYCTRPDRHPEDEVHVCRLMSESTGEPIAVVVWGGE